MFKVVNNKINKQLTDINEYDDLSDGTAEDLTKENTPNKAYYK